MRIEAIAMLSFVLAFSFASISMADSGIPSWVRNNAGWWAEGQIDDGSFVSGIQFMLEEGIISIEKEEKNTDSIQWAENPKQEFDIIIIGSGIAGMAAADSLVAEGKEVLVLEAKDRTGGRIWSHMWNGVTIEEGANWIHHSDGNPLTEFAEKEGFSMIDTPADSIVTYWENEEIGEEYEVLFGEFQSYIISNQGNGKDRSLQEMFEEFSEKNLLDEDRATVLGYLANSRIAHEYAANLENLSRDYFDIGDEFGVGEALFPEGLSQVIDTLASGVDVRLGHVVTKIEYGEGGATVHTTKGKFYSEKVLVTVSLGVLKNDDIEFFPPLPQEKTNAIDSMGMGLLQKHWMLFDEVFWDNDVVWILMVNDQNWECVDFSYTQKPILLCFTVGKHAMNQENMPKDTIIGEIMEILRDTYGQDISNPIDTHLTKWASDKFTYGSYSYTAVGNTPSTYNTIREPIDDTVFFAGEHTHEKYPATIHGAYLSGIRAAEEMN